MKNLLLATLLALPQIHAQDAAPAAPIDMAARRQSVVDIKAHIASREQRLMEIADEIRALDERNEKRIDSIVNLLSQIKDSKDSKTNINSLKGDVIAGLRKSITIYQQKRAEILERLRKDKSLSMEALTKDMERFDVRTQKRVDQIMGLAKSMPQREDVDKYEDDGGHYRNGWYYETSRISEDWKQNRRQGVATEKSLRELREALEKAISTQESRRASIAEMLKNRNLSDAERAIQEQELGRTDALLENRRMELVELGLPSTTRGSSASDSGSASSEYGESEKSATATDAANDDSADAIKDLLEDSRSDISRDFWDILRKYGQAANERDKILALKANLAAREKWLEENDKGSN